MGDQEPTSVSAQSKEMLREFDAALAKYRSELLTNLDRIDLLEPAQVTGLVQQINQRLVVLQHDFLRYVSGISGTTSAGVERFKLSPEETTILPEAAAGTAGAGAGAVLVNLISWSVPGWIWGATTTTLAGSVATYVGVGASLVTLGAGALVGAAVGGAIYMARLPARRSYIRKSILRSFDKKAAPKLRQWARKAIGLPARKSKTIRKS